MNGNAPPAKLLDGAALSQTRARGRARRDFDGLRGTRADRLSAFRHHARDESLPLADALDLECDGIDRLIEPVEPL